MAKNNTPAVKQSEESLGIVEAVSTKVESLKDKNRIDFPPDYSYQNALKSAWLAIAECKGKKGDNYLPAFEICTRTSIYNALFGMVISGLTPAKDQVYPIVYGNKLSLQRSYFGEMALAYRMDPTIVDIRANVVYKGDAFEFEINDGLYKITKHTQTLKSIDSGEIQAAYCIIIWPDRVKTELMTWKEIARAWEKSKQHPVSYGKDGKVILKKGSVHEEFTSDMAKRTVVRKACKFVINSSSDSWLKKAIEEVEVQEETYKAEYEIDKKANKKDLDFVPERATVIEDLPPITERGGQQPEVEETPSPSPQLAFLAEQKESFGEEIFYRVLGNNGFTDIEEVPENRISSLLKEMARVSGPPEEEEIEGLEF